MSVSKFDIRTIASLARLEIDDSAMESFIHEFTDILDLVRQMQEIDTSGIVPMPHPQDIELRLRADKITEPNQRSDLQLLAPAVENGLYLVPKVID